MTLNLDAIKQRAGLKRWPTVAELGLIKEDNTALVAEVERLRGVVDEMTKYRDHLKGLSNSHHIVVIASIVQDLTDALETE